MSSPRAMPILLLALGPLILGGWPDPAHLAGEADSTFLWVQPGEWPEPPCPGRRCCHCAMRREVRVLAERWRAMRTPTSEARRTCRTTRATETCGARHARSAGAVRSARSARAVAVVGSVGSCASRALEAPRDGGTPREGETLHAVGRAPLPARLARDGPRTVLSRPRQGPTEQILRDPNRDQGCQVYPCSCPNSVRRKLWLADAPFPAPLSTAEQSSWAHQRAEQDGRGILRTHRDLRPYGRAPPA